MLQFVAVAAAPEEEEEEEEDRDGNETKQELFVAIDKELNMGLVIQDISSQWIVWEQRRKGFKEGRKKGNGDEEEDKGRE